MKKQVCKGFAAVLLSVCMVLQLALPVAAAEGRLQASSRKMGGGEIVLPCGKYVSTGRTETRTGERIVYEENEDGSYKTDENGDLIPKRDENGDPVKETYS